MVKKGVVHVIPALVTPYDDRGRVSEGSLRKLIRWNIEKGATGFYVGGSSGEALLLTLDERERIAEIARSEVPAELAFICHVGALSTADAERLARHAGRIGADAISAIPPIYYKYGVDEITAYYRDIAESAGLPLIVYNIPSFSSIDMKVDFIAKLYEHPLIRGVKYTAYDLYDLERVRSRDAERLLFIGHDELFMPALALGADGGIGSAFNIMAEKFVSIVGLLGAKRLEEAAKVQGEVNRIVCVLLANGIFPSIKYALELLGIPCGTCRRPFRPLCEAAKTAVREEVVARL